jgi:metal-dependent amidase/aminoacylase/carboxypeptidase family protein
VLSNDISFLSLSYPDLISQPDHETLKLHRNPELGMQEYHSHDLLTEFLERKGFKVTRHAYGMETAFTAEFTNGPGRRVGLCSEYDGLKG